MKLTAEKPVSGEARLGSQAQPQHLGWNARAAAGASAFASLRRDESHTAAVRPSIPTGLHHPAQGCEARAALGKILWEMTRASALYFPFRFTLIVYGGRNSIRNA